MARKSSHLKVVKEADVDVIIANMSKSFMECRDWGHSWRAYTVGVDRRNNIFEQTLRCSRCYTHRLRTISGSGNLIKTRYQYKDGYLIPGWGRMSRDDKAILRLAIIREMMMTHGREIEVIEA
jgi:hypothetical protein